VRLTPKLNFSGTALLYFRAWDQTDGATPGSAVNLVGNIGSTAAYSKVWDTATLAVAPTNDAPVLDKSVSPELDSVTEDSSGSAGTLVSQVLGGINDTDANAIKGVAVTGLTRSGIWEYSLDDGATWLTLGSSSESAAIVLRPSDRVRLTPKLNFSGTTLLYFRAWDQTDGATPGSAVNLVGNVGGTTAYSKAWDTAALVVAPVNDAPLLAGISGTIGYVRDAAAVQIVPSAAVSDVDSPDFDGGELRVRISDGADASNFLALSGSFTVDGSNQVFSGTTLIGSRSSDGNGFNDLVIEFNGNVTSAIATQLIRSITFTTSGGLAGVRKMAFTISDGDGSASDEKTKTVDVA
jgi:hypothetical protein